jgi:hypothetical protein
MQKAVEKREVQLKRKAQKAHLLLYTIIGNLYLFPLILQKDILSINGLTMILKFIGQCDDKQITMLPNKNNNISFEILKYIINLITARPIELTHSDTSNNISLNLHNCRFYMYYIISELLIQILQNFNCFFDILVAFEKDFQMITWKLVCYSAISKVTDILRNV